MVFEYNIAKIAQLIGDGIRAAILNALMNGQALTAGELALRADISAQTASNHLKKLLDAELIRLVKASSRYRYYSLASPHVAEALEALSILAKTPNIKSPKRYIDPDICYARTCYDHMAGKLAIQLRKAFEQKGYIVLHQDKYQLTREGKSFFKTLGIHYTDLEKQKRSLLRPCLDWTEREYHIAGSLGAAILQYFIENHFVLASKNKSRVLTLTMAGKAWLASFQLYKD